VSLTAAPPASTASTSASFRWAATGDVTSTTCSLDSAPPAPCSSPMAYFGLPSGHHTFTVTVTNSGGSNSATFGWTETPVFEPAPGSTLTSTPQSSLTASAGNTLSTGTIPLATGTTSTPIPAGSLYVTPNGNDGDPCTLAAPCKSFNGAYQRAQPGQVISVAPGTYSGQVIQRNPTAVGLGCTVTNQSPCIRITGSGITINGSLEIHGSNLWIDGGQRAGGPYGITVTGYTDTEADNPGSYPDHVVVSGVDTTSFGVFNSNTVTFEDMDVGPATVSAGCGILEGPGIENKIGSGGGILSPVPTNVVLDGLVIHDQNGDAGRIASDCHFGGLFLQTANGLTVKNTVFQGNVVYNVQIQNFGALPAPTNVVFDRDSFGCPVTWLYQGAGCDGQSSIQFDGTFPAITIQNSVFTEAAPGWGCYVGTCDFAGDTFSNNTFAVPPDRLGIAGPSG
jgi:hypothetical protein